MAYKFIATRLTRVEAEALERILKRRRETIYSLLPSFRIHVYDEDMDMG